MAYNYIQPKGGYSVAEIFRRIKSRENGIYFREIPIGGYFITRGGSWKQYLLWYKDSDNWARAIQTCTVKNSSKSEPPSSWRHIGERCSWDGSDWVNRVDHHISNKEPTAPFWKWSDIVPGLFIPEGALTGGFDFPGITRWNHTEVTYHPHTDTTEMKESKSMANTISTVRVRKGYIGQVISEQRIDGIHSILWETRPISPSKETAQAHKKAQERAAHLAKQALIKAEFKVFEGLK